MFATVFCGSIFAQEQGSMMIDGAMGLDFNSYSVSEVKVTFDGNETSTTENLPKYTDLSVNLTGGYFLMDGMALGLSIQMEQNKSETDGVADSKYTETTTMFGPMVRYYIGETGVFANLSYLMGSEKTDVDGDEPVKRSQLSIGAGYGIALADNVHLNPMLKYNMDKSKVDYSGVETEAKWGGIQFNVGMTIMM